MAEVEIKENRYSFDKMGLFQASDVARIWSYALVMLAKSPADLKPEDFVKAFPMFVAMLPKAENDFAMNTCLQTVKRALGGDKGWAPLINSSGDLMYQDLGLSGLYQLIFHVLNVNELMHFFGDPRVPSALAGEQDQTTS